MRRAGIAFFLGALTLGTSPILADETFLPGCRAVLHEEGVRRENRALDVGLAETRSAAAAEIYGLVAKLWEQENIERIIYLRAKRNRDLARLEVERAAKLLDRQTTYVEQLRLQCDLLTDRGTKKDRQEDAEAIHLRYREADCDAHAASKAMAEVDLAYGREVLANVLDLRENKVATRQDVIIAERDVELSRKRLEDATRRVAACREELEKLRRASSD